MLRGATFPNASQMDLGALDGSFFDVFRVPLDVGSRYGVSGVLMGKIMGSGVLLNE